jgi:23S rRNA pseudouridine1911/1915/1917 synthase
VGITDRTITAIVPDELTGERADKVVATLAGVSRSTARAMLEHGDATVDGSVVAPSTRIGGGARVEAVVPARRVLEPEPIPFGVLFDDDVMAVVDKPAGLVVHPGAGNERGTLAAGLIHRWPEIVGVGEEDRWGIVHRLDRDTSGAMLVAKSGDAYRSLTAALARRDVTRRYLALTVGSFDIPTGTIEAPIARDPSDPTRFAVSALGRAAVTHYEVERQFEDSALLEVTLQTGRTHQIRVHLSSIGHPIAGDRLYGWSGVPAVPRIFLHAASLTFPHPRHGRTTVKSPLPDDLEKALVSLS